MQEHVIRKVFAKHVPASAHRQGVAQFAGLACKLPA